MSGNESGSSVANSDDYENAELASRILVAVPTLNEAANIRNCLLSLGYNSDAMKKACFVIADGGSSDETQNIVREMASDVETLFLLENPLKLQSAGINAVAESQYAETRDILIRCDAHAVYPEGYVLRLARSLLEHGTASVVVPMDSVGQTCFARGAAWVVDTPFGSGGAAHRGGAKSGFIDHGHHAAFDLNWFRKIGGYDPTFSHNEDAEYDKRLVDAGGRIWMDADIRLDYFMRPSFSALARQYRNYGRGRMKTLLKHRTRPRLRQLLPVVLLFVLAFSLLGGLLVHPVLYLGAVAYLAILCTATVLVYLKQRSTCALWAGPALAAMHLAWAVGAVETFIRFKRD